MGTSIIFFVCWIAITINPVRGDFNPPRITSVPPVLKVYENTENGTKIGQFDVSVDNGDSLKQIDLSYETEKLVLMNFTSTGSNTYIVNIYKDGMYDRDYAPASRALYFTVHGQTSKTDRSITLFIQDVNDNAPTFINLPYQPSIAENTAIGTTVNVNIKATDPDNGAGGSVTYSMQAAGQSSGLSQGVFIINSITGAVTVNGTVDYETLSFYQYNVTASDGVGLKSYADLIIRVQDVQDQPPFFQGLPYLKTISEEANQNSLVLTVKAQDGDRGVPCDVEFKLENGTCRDFFNINSTSGEVKVVRTLDRDKGPIKGVGGVCGLNVTAYEKQNCTNANVSSTTTQITINIQDENDNSPTFNQSTYEATITEELTDIPLTIKNASGIYVYDNDQGSNSVFEIKVFEADGITPFNNITAVPSEVHSSGLILLRLKNPFKFDYEEEKNVTLQINATETKTATPNSGTCVIHVQILNANDNYPLFNKTQYAAEIPENSNNGTFVIKMEATDKDSGSFGNVTYELQGSHEKFRIDPISGVVSTNADNTPPHSLDRETQDRYYLTVEAKDGGGKRTPALLTITLKDINDNRPKFLISNYNFVVSENSKNFTTKASVSATDKDEGNNATVGYRLGLSNSSDLYQNIAINESTGILFLNDTLDREELNSSKICIPIIAFDHGEPPLSSTVTATLSVMDLNDNSPQFNNSAYQADVMENSGRGTIVTSVYASDSDSTAPNNNFRFFIESGASEQFRIDGSTGVISVQVDPNLDRESQHMYNLTVLAIDQGTPQRNGSTTVYITVLDENDEPPEFTQQTFSATVREDQTGNGTIVVCNATDPDTNYSLSYSMDVEKAYDYEGNKLVNLTDFQDWFGIRSSLGAVYIKQRLDAEKVRRLEFVLNVTDTYALKNVPQTATASLIIDISDVNDEVPRFQPDDLYNITLSEAAVKETNVLTVSASDNDVTSINRDISYSIVQNYEQDTFSIDKKSGTLSLVQPDKIDREKNDSINIIVVASDGINNSTATVMITVLDANDNTPQFTKKNYSFNVEERNYTECMTIGNISATDKDIGDNGRITYSITKGNTVFFHVNDTTGELCAIGDINRETDPSFNLEITAKDNPSMIADMRNNITTVRVQVLDVNDNKPTFGLDEYKTEVLESITIHSSVITIQATDPDNGENGTVHYVIGSRGNGTSNFLLDNSTIKTNVSLLNDIGTYAVEVIAMDNGTPPKNASVFVYITVLDENNNDPEFLNAYRNYSVYECAELETEVFQINATDKDKDNNARLTYQFRLPDGTMSSTFANFTIDNTTGVIYVSGGLDREQKKEYEVTVEISDNGKPKRSKTTPVLTIEIMDINDNPPVFDPSVKIVPVEENKKNVTLITVTATDKDSNHEIQYTIKNVSPSYLEQNFTVDKSSGSVQLLGSLDREKTTSVNITIKATDATQTQNLTTQCPHLGLQTQTNSTTMTLLVNVKDVNDNPPKFKDKVNRKYFRASILRSAKYGDAVTDLKDDVQNDPDLPENSIHKYYMLNISRSEELRAQLQSVHITGACSDGQLTELCVNITGTVITNMVFPESAKGYFELFILVNDSAGNDTAKLRVHIIGDSQLVYMNVRGDKVTVDRDRESLFNEFNKVFNPTYEFVFDSYEPVKDSDGTVNTFWTMVVFHVVETSDDRVLEATNVLRMLDSNADKLQKVRQEYRVYEIEAYTGRQQSSTETKIKTTYVLIAVISLLALILCITIFFYINSTSRYKRKLKAATITVTDMNDEKNPDSLYFPGSNVFSSTKNPLLNKDDEVKRVSDNLNEPGDSNSEHYFEINNEVFEQKHLTDGEPLEEKEVVMEMYGEDTPQTEDKLNTLLMALEKENVDDHGRQLVNGMDNPAYQRLETTEV